MDKKSFSIERRDYVSPQVMSFSIEVERLLADGSGQYGDVGAPGAPGADGLFVFDTEEEDY